MSSYNYYKKFLNDIFGEGQIELEEATFIENNISGAIRHYDLTGKDFNFFVTNFKKRLIRLNEQYQGNEKVIKDIIIKSKNIAKKKWFGEYSELVAYDFFSSFFALETEISVEKGRTYAAILPGRTASSFDGKINKGEFQLIFEVKSLTDVSKALIDNIIKAAKARNNKALEITVIYNQDIEYTLIEDNFKVILNGLNQEINNGKKSYSPEGMNLTFEIHYHVSRGLVDVG
jgi:hypothetical protein